MEKWTHGHHQKGTEESKKDQFCDDNLVQYESAVTEHTDSECLGQTLTGDFTVSEDSTSQPLMSRKQIEEALDQLLTDVKNKRENDLKILSDVKKEIMAQATQSCTQLEQLMGHMHVIKSKELDKQIVILMNALSKSQKLECELDQSKTSLSLLCKDITNSVQFM